VVWGGQKKTGNQKKFQPRKETDPPAREEKVEISPIIKQGPIEAGGKNSRLGGSRTCGDRNRAYHKPKANTKLGKLFRGLKRSGIKDPAPNRRRRKGAARNRAPSRGKNQWTGKMREWYVKRHSHRWTGGGARKGFVQASPGTRGKNPKKNFPGWGEQDRHRRGRRQKWVVARQKGRGGENGT